MGKTRRTGDLVSDDNIFVDVSNDRVGIGTTQPTTKFEVKGDSGSLSYDASTGTLIVG
jgi:hypothetical protein